eukprot:4505248-Alexandrium_andersonii.AAC.1
MGRAGRTRQQTAGPGLESKQACSPLKTRACNSGRAYRPNACDFGFAKTLSRVLGAFGPQSCFKGER